MAERRGEVLLASPCVFEDVRLGGARRFPRAEVRSICFRQNLSSGAPCPSELPDADADVVLWKDGTQTQGRASVGAYMNGEVIYQVGHPVRRRSEALYVQFARP